MNYLMLEMLETEERIKNRGFHPGRMLRLLRLIKYGDKAPAQTGRGRKNICPAEYIWQDTAERNPGYGRRRGGRQSGRTLLCFECGAPLGHRKICPQCAMDNQFAVQLGICKEMEEMDGK